jgi:hypothetical protein
VSDYRRTTAATTFDGVPEPMLGALRAEAEAAMLTVPGGAPAYVTRSERLRKRLFGGDKDPFHLTAVVLGPYDVLVCVHGEHRGTSVLTARLEDLDTSDRLMDLARERGLATDDDGLTLTGFAVSGPDGGRGSFWVGLGDPDGARARTAIGDAIRAAKRA